MFAGKRLITGFMLLLALTAVLAACSSPASSTTSSGESSGGTGGTGNTGATANGTSASQPTQAPMSGSTPGSNGDVAPGAPAQPTTQAGNGGSIGVLPTPTNGAPGNGPVAPNQGATAAANSNGAGGTSGTGGTGTQGNGGSQPSGTAVAGAIPASLDPCTLVTPADIQAAVGFPVQAGRRSNDQNGGASCQFIGTQNNTNTVGITVYQGSQEVNAAQQNMGGAQAQAVPGLGDQAFFVNNGLYVRSGNNLFSVGIAAPNQQNQGQNQVMNAAVALARRIIVKLSPII